MNRESKRVSGKNSEVKERPEEDRSRQSLEKEIKALRAGLKKIAERIDAGAGDLPKLASLLARVCDSLVRALLAQQKLSARDDRQKRLQGDIERVLRELGYGEVE